MSRNFTIFVPEAIREAGFATTRPVFGGHKNKPTAAQSKGIRYERRAQDYMWNLYPDRYVQNPWLMFYVKGEPLPRWCQPDGLIVDIVRLEIIIVEIKLRHMKEAYTQVTGIYHPVLKKIFPEPWVFRHLEVTRFYDPHVPFPAKIQLVSHPDLTPRHVFGVHIFN